MRLFIILMSAAALGACATMPFVTVRDGHFYAGDERFRFLGANVYSLASSPAGSAKYSCGNRFSDVDIDRMLDEIASFGGSTVRLAAFQPFTDGGNDFSRLDVIVAKARSHRMRLILTLENQWADCTESGYKSAEWYRAGYREPYGRRPSYRDYVAKVVRRYRDEPAIMMWQLMNEAESKSAAGVPEPLALLAFTKDMSALVKSIDPNHLLSLGTIGGNPDGVAGDPYADLSAVSGIDAVEAHDFDDTRMFLAPWTKRCFEVARLVGKPCFVGEMGMSVHGEADALERSFVLAARLAAVMEFGYEGVLIWSYRAGDGRGYDFDGQDPLVPALRRFSRRSGLFPR